MSMFTTFQSLKHFPLFLVLTVVILSQCIPALSLAGNKPRDRRSLEAYEQLREYRRETAITRNKSNISKLRGISATQQQVHIALNPTAGVPSNIYFYDNMEAGTNGWTTASYSGGPDMWHQSAINASSPTHAWWAGDEGSSNYRTGARVNAAAITPTVDLTTAAAPLTLMFAENYMTERGWDYCMVDVSTNGGTTWNALRGGYGQAPSGSSGGWTITSLDLSAFAGQQIKIRFHFDTSDSTHNEFPGWFVDDVVIFNQGGAIQGHVFMDANQNTLRDDGEQGLKNWIVTATGPITVSVSSGYHGHYYIPLPLGTYTVSEALQPGWTQTAPLGGTYTLILDTPDTLISTRHFGNFLQQGSVTGMVFNDVNHNGVYDAGDSTLTDWNVVLADTTDNQDFDYDRTDSNGVFTLFAPSAGNYIVEQGIRYGWVQSLPADGDYKVTIADANTVITGKNFGDYKTDSVQAIIGWNFNDRNRNGIQSFGEDGVENFAIQLFRKNGTSKFHYWKQTRTDSSGFYRFASMPPDTYKVAEVGKNGWWHSTPETTSAFPVTSGQFKDSVTFGIYEISPSTIAGTVYNDENGNAAFDGGEPGLGNWRVNLTGPVTATVYSDSQGAYSLNGLWPGKYTVSEVWKGGFVQTAPPTPGVYTFVLGPEENRTGTDFGNIDSNYTASFRTFTSDSLALAVDAKGKHNPIVAKANHGEFSVVFTNHTDSAAAKLITHYLKAPVFASMASSAPGTFATAGKANKIEFTFTSPLLPDSSVIISGTLAKAGVEAIGLVKWVDQNGHQSPKDTAYSWLVNTGRLPMPNAINVLQSVGANLRVGLGGPHSMVAGSYKDVVASLVEGKDRVHVGVARCLDVTSGGASIKKQVKQLPIKKHNNKLLAEAIALQTNIRASLVGVTPPGFSGLVFEDDSPNAFNGMTMIEIAATLDSAMSSAKDTIKPPVCSLPSAWSSMTFEMVYQNILRINGAFSGPFDTTSFAAGLHLSGVKTLADVSFLRFDAAAAARAARLAENFSIVAENVPEQFSLYQNYPNPFNPVTTIRFDLPSNMIVTLKVYNMLGQEVGTIANREEMESGTQELQFDGSSLASGVYFYRLVAEPTVNEDGVISGQMKTAIGKMLLVK